MAFLLRCRQHRLGHKSATNNQITYDLSDVAVLIRRVWGAFQVLLVYQQLYTLLDHGDLWCKPCPGLTDHLVMGEKRINKNSAGQTSHLADTKSGIITPYAKLPELGPIFNTENSRLAT